MMIYAMVLLGLTGLTVLLSGIKLDASDKTFSRRAETAVCAAALIFGAALRLWNLTGLPSGISAEEALVGVQAKALWKTGGFLFDGKWTTQLAQWTLEPAGPLLAVLTAPFVGMFGLSPLTVRLPLALVSCLSVFAAYGLGNLLSGRRAARWLMIVYAVSPFFVLTARLTYAASLSAALLPIALYCVLKGLRKPLVFYVGIALTALLAYAQRMYLWIAPLAIALFVFFAACRGMKKRHAVGAGVLGFVLVLPALLTIWVNLPGHESMMLLGKIQIPRIEGFEMARVFFADMEPNIYTLQNKLWDVLAGAVFQIVFHSNISPELYAPKSMLAFHFLSLPLIACGALVLITRFFEHRKTLESVRTQRQMTLGLAAITFVILFLFGQAGVVNIRIDECCDVFDYSAFFLFDALLMTAALCFVERKRFASAVSMTVIYGLSAVFLCAHLFTNAYAWNANVYFSDFKEAAVCAHQASEEMHTKVNITSAVYPHKCSEEAAEMMYLYAVEAEPEDVNTMRENTYQITYIGSDAEPDLSQIYIVRPEDIVDWDTEDFAYQEFGRFVLLTPKTL